MIGLFKRRKPRVYLNAIRVAKLDEDFNFLDRFFSPEYKEIDSRMEILLKEVVTLPRVSARENAEKTDLGVDIIVPDYETGGLDFFNFGEGAIPLWWRPRVKAVSRLFCIESNETVKEFTVVQKMGWKRFLFRVFHIRTLFGLSGIQPEDFEFLMLNACSKLVDKMRKAI